MDGRKRKGSLGERKDGRAVGALLLAGADQAHDGIVAIVEGRLVETRIGQRGARNLSAKLIATRSKGDVVDVGWEGR